MGHFYGMTKRPCGLLVGHRHEVIFYNDHCNHSSAIPNLILAETPSIPVG
jgi:hypothetical protein